MGQAQAQELPQRMKFLDESIEKKWDSQIVTLKKSRVWQASDVYQVM